MRYRLALVMVASAAVLIAAACGGTDETPDTDDVIPAGFDFLLKVRLADILNDPDVSAIYGAAPKDEDAPQTLDELLGEIGEGAEILRQVEEVVVFGAIANFNDEVGVVARGEFQEEAVLAAFAEQGETPASSTDYNGRTIHSLQDEDVDLTLMDDLLVIASPDVLRRVIDVHEGDAEPASGPVHDAFSAVGDPLFRLVAALPEDALEELDLPFGGAGVGLGFLGDLQIITVVVDKTESSFQSTAVVDFGSEASATDARDAVDALLTLARLSAPGDEIEKLLKTLELAVSGRRLTAEIEVSVSELKDLAGSLGDPATGLGGLFGLRSEGTSAPPVIRGERAVPVRPSPVAVTPAPTATPGVAAATPRSTAAGAGERVPVMASAAHRPEGESIDYGAVPPTSGLHWSRWADCGVHDEEVPDERVVHNMEHGHVIISYNLDPELAPVIEQLARRLEGFASFGVMRPYSKIEPGTVAMTAWGFIDRVEGVDPGRIAAFYDEHSANRYSEETRAVGPIPCR